MDISVGQVSQPQVDERHIQDSETLIAMDSGPRHHELVREMQQKFYTEFLWSVPLPKPVQSPLLYEPTVVKEAGQFPRRNISSADLAGMATGLLEGIDTSYFVMNPDDIREMTDIVTTNEKEFEESQKTRERAGYPRLTNASAMQRNKNLTESDFKLVDVDFDEDPLSHRQLPSLALLQKPLYTEIGLIPKEVRHAARLSRLVGDTQDALGEDSQAFLEHHGRSSGAMAHDVPATHRIPKNDDEWREAVNLGFRRAARLDHSFNDFLDNISIGKLGVKHIKEEERVELARKLLRLLAACAPCRVTWQRTRKCECQGPHVDWSLLSRGWLVRKETLRW